MDQCVANNNARLRRQEEEKNGKETGSAPDIDVEEPYPPELLDNLIFRYEEPSTHSRWDKPLFTVPWEDPEPPVADIFHALTGVILPSAEPPTVTPINPISESLAASNMSSAASTTTTARTFTRGAASRPKKIVPHQATVLSAPTDSSALYAMEKRTSAIVTAIRTFTQSNPSAEAALAQSSNSQGIAIDVPGATIPILIPAHVATSGTTDELAGAGGILPLPKLQRLRRQWISLNRVYIARGHDGGAGGLASDQIPDAFVRFLNSTFGDEGEDV